MQRKSHSQNAGHRQKTAGHEQLTHAPDAVTGHPRGGCNGWAAKQCYTLRSGYPVFATARSSRQPSTYDLIPCLQSKSNRECLNQQSTRKLSLLGSISGRTVAISDSTGERLRCGRKSAQRRFSDLVNLDLHQTSALITWPFQVRSSSCQTGIR